MTHTIAHITPPVIQTSGGPQYMVPIGNDLGVSSPNPDAGNWRSILFIHPGDMQEFAKSASGLKLIADDHHAQENTAARLNWPKRAVLVELYTNGVARINIGAETHANITHYGTTTYRPDQIEECNLRDPNSPLIRVVSMDASEFLHKAIHHLGIAHKHGIDPTDNKDMPPSSPLMAVLPRMNVAAAPGSAFKLEL